MKEREREREIKRERDKERDYYYTSTFFMGFSINHKNNRTHTKKKYEI